MDRKRLEQLKAIKQAKRAKLKDKPFKNLSTKEKNELLETIAIMLGLIEE